MKRFGVLLLVLGIVYFDSAQCMTEAQIKNAIKLVRQMCQPKFKLTNAQIDNMHKGIFDDDNKQACYMNCGLNSLKFMKNGKMDYDYAIGQLKSLPESWRGPLNHALDECKESTTSNDKCEAAYQLAKCMYNAEPDFYILP